jgi:hypothetical protein
VWKVVGKEWWLTLFINEEVFVDNVKYLTISGVPVSGDDSKR